MKEEGGITQNSLENAKEIIARHGKPYSLHFSACENKCDYTVTATFGDGFAFAFTGFSWNYNGEGPRGLDQFLAMCETNLKRSDVEAESKDGETNYTYTLTAVIDPRD